MASLHPHPARGPFPYASASAIVTGATSGIGEAIARALVQRGVPSLLLVARDEEDLAKQAETLRAAPSRPHVEILPLDLTHDDAAERVHARSASLSGPLLLVSAAGAGSVGPFAQPRGRGASATDLVDLNARAVVHLAERLLPGMLEARAGGILHVGSTAAFVPAPFSAVYAATKAFVVSFSQALWAETRLRGVRVACVVPGVTETNMAGEDQGEPRGGLEKLTGTLDPATVAQAALSALDRNAPLLVVGRRNRVSNAFVGALPSPLVARIIAAFKRPDAYREVAPFPARPFALGLGAAAGLALWAGTARRR